MLPRVPAVRGMAIPTHVGRGPDGRLNCLGGVRAPLVVVESKRRGLDPVDVCPGGGDVVVRIVSVLVVYRTVVGP